MPDTTVGATRPQKVDDQTPWTMLFSVTLGALVVRTLMLLGVLATPSAVLSVLWAVVLFVAVAASLRFAASRDDIGSRHVSDTLVLAIAVGAFAWMFPHFAGYAVEGGSQRLGVALTGAGAGGLVGSMILVTSTRARATVATSAFIAATALLLTTALLFQAEGFTAGLVIAIGAEAFALFGRREPPASELDPSMETLRAPRSFVSLLTAIVALLGVQQAFAKNVWSDNLPAIIVLGVMFAAAVVSVTDATRQMQRASSDDSTNDDFLTPLPDAGRAAPPTLGGTGITGTYGAPSPMGGSLPSSAASLGAAPLGGSLGAASGAAGAAVGAAGAAVSPGGSLPSSAVGAAAPAVGGAGAAVAGAAVGGAGVVAGAAGPIPGGGAPEPGLRIGSVSAGSDTSNEGQLFGTGADNRRHMTISTDEDLRSPTPVPSAKTAERSLADLAQHGVPIAAPWLDSDDESSPAGAGSDQSRDAAASSTPAESGGIFGAAIAEILVVRDEAAKHGTESPVSGADSKTDVPEVQWGRRQTTTNDVDDTPTVPTTPTKPATATEPKMAAEPQVLDEADPFFPKPGGGFMAIPRTADGAASTQPMASPKDSVAEGLATYKAATAWTHNGIMLGGNAEFWSLIERSPVADFQLLSVVHPEDRPLLAQAISRGTRTGASNRMTLRFVPNPSRGSIWVRGVGGTYQSDVGPLGEVPNASWQLSFAPTDPETDPEQQVRYDSYDLETGLLDERYLQHWLKNYDPDGKRHRDRPLLLVIEASHPRRYDSAPLRERRSVMSEMAGALLEATRATDTIIRLPGPYLVIITEDIPDGEEWPVMSRFMPLTDTPLSELQELLTELPAHASRVVPMRIQTGTAVSDIQAMMAQTLES